ncbi:MAG: carbonic anhydrase [Oligoflexia bacterium]|nr:carbonic anhydrase [Oligoflexia bacterium]
MEYFRHLITLLSFLFFAYAATASAHESNHTVNADAAIELLKSGNTRFYKNRMRKDGNSTDDRKRLTKGQHPHTIVLSCSDSRVPPEHVFDQALGEIFTIRVASEAIDSSVLASVEFAVENLGSKLILVMGHTSCGAIKAALNAKEGESNGSPSLDKLIGDIKPRISSAARGPAETDVAEEASINAKGVARDLAKRSKILEAKISTGKLKIASALYYLDTGKVDFH